MMFLMKIVQVLLKEGGIYLDTDIVLTKKLPISQMQNAIAYEMYDGNTLNNSYNLSFYWRKVVFC